MLVGFGHNFGDAGGVAKPEIEPLRADRRHHMGCFADERDAIARNGIGGLDREREDAAARFNSDVAEQPMRPAFDRVRQFRIVLR